MGNVGAVDTDALVIGAGPAGASAAIRLAQKGWRVILVEQHDYPRQKVCGECISAGNLTLIDELGIGPEFARLAGPELREVGWMSASATLEGKFPACTTSRYRFGRALGRDVFDSLLLERARSVGVRILQPAKVRAVGGSLGGFHCHVEDALKATIMISAAIIIDAHGSWEAGPTFAGAATGSGLGNATSAGAAGDGSGRVAPTAADLFAFKARFDCSALAPGLLPVIAFGGGYGGIVVSDGGQTTLACCIRRDALKISRTLAPGTPAGVAVETLLRRSCLGVGDALRDARRKGSWLSVGPIRPGIRLEAPCGVFRIGNAAGESHPLIGEGISMALQSAQMLVNELTRRCVSAIDADEARLVQHRYARAWKQHFAPRLRLSALYAHVAMRPIISAPLGRLLHRWPELLTEAARLAGKARDTFSPPLVTRGMR